MHHHQDNHLDNCWRNLSEVQEAHLPRQGGQVDTFELPSLCPNQPQWCLDILQNIWSFIIRFKSSTRRLSGHIWVVFSLPKPILLMLMFSNTLNIWIFKWSNLVEGWLAGLAVIVDIRNIQSPIHYLSALWVKPQRNLEFKDLAKWVPPPPFLVDMIFSDTKYLRTIVGQFHFLSNMWYEMRRTFWYHIL